MKIEIETAINGYIITIPPDGEDGIERKIVIQESEDSTSNNDSKIEFEAFSKLIGQLQDIFCIHNSKHNKVGYLQGLCSENERWKLYELMENSLENPKNDLGD